jgi:hypothetical protein
VHVHVLCGFLLACRGEIESLIDACLAWVVVNWASWPKFNYIIAWSLWLYDICTPYNAVDVNMGCTYWTVRVRWFREVLVLVFCPG